jgi:inhibitor of cysteine peptidase
MELTPQDSGVERSVDLSEPIVVRLPENPTTGYRWEADVDGAALRVVGDELKTSAVPRGAGGVRVVRFEAVRPGPTTLRLVKRRRWEREATEEFVVPLRVLSPQRDGDA